MEKKTTEGVDEGVKKTTRKTSAIRKPRTTRKKAAANDEVVENTTAEAEKQPQSETTVERKRTTKSTKKTTTQRRGRKSKDDSEQIQNESVQEQLNADKESSATEKKEETVESVTSQITTTTANDDNSSMSVDSKPVSNNADSKAETHDIHVEIIEKNAEEAKSESKADDKISQDAVEEAITAEDADDKQEENAESQSSKNNKQKQQIKPIPPLPHIRIDSIIALANAPRNQIILSDQQIQQLTVAEAIHRHNWLEGVLAYILDYDVVLSDTNIWIELLVGHTSSHSDPRVNARLMFERQLEFISKLAHYRGGRFMMMAETYEEIDRFATQQDPVNYKEADFSDELVCRNIAARLAKRLILSQQRENRLRIEGICAESHHSAFADPAIIRRTVELFADGKKVLLLTNDASVAIRSMGMCDDLQLVNGIDDETWDKVYAPLRPMVMTMDDLKLLDVYTRQYHFLQMAAGKQWMEDVPRKMSKHNVQPLMLWLDGFRPGDKYAENHEEKQMKKRISQQKQKEKEQKVQQNKQTPAPQKQNNPQQKQNNAQQKQQQQNQSQNQNLTVQQQNGGVLPNEDSVNVQHSAVNNPKEQQSQQKTKVSGDSLAQNTLDVNAASIAEQKIDNSMTNENHEAVNEEQPKKRQYRRRPQQRRRSQ